MRLYELLHVLPWDLPVTLCDLSADSDNHDGVDARDAREARPHRTTAQNLFINPEAYTLVTYYFMDPKENLSGNPWLPFMHYDVSHTEISMRRVAGRSPLEPVAKIYIRKHGQRDSRSELHRVQDEIRQELSEKIGD